MKKNKTIPSYEFYNTPFENVNCKTAKRLKTHMSLVELLIVIAVMTILMTISMPGFVSMMKGAGVEGSARNICQVLKLARTHAINNNEYVAVLMPQKDSDTTYRPGQEESGLSDLYFNRSYRVCVVTKNGTDYDFRRWIDGESWEFLPVGCSFFEVDADPGVATNSGSLAPDNNPLSISIVRYVDYSDVGGNAISNDQNSFLTAAIIFKPSGRTPGERYVEIGEGTFASGTLVITNPDPDAYLSVKVDQFTGRISFGDE